MYYIQATTAYSRQNFIQYHRKLNTLNIVKSVRKVY